MIVAIAQAVRIYNLRSEVAVHRFLGHQRSDIIERQPWERCLRRKARSDVYADQFTGTGNLGRMLGYAGEEGQGLRVGLRAVTAARA